MRFIKNLRSRILINPVSLCPHALKQGDSLLLHYIYLLYTIIILAINNALFGLR